MKNENGITLSALVITIIVIFILASISINYGVDTLNESKAKTLEASLEMVEQAVAEQYVKATELNLLNVKTTSEQPATFVGTIIKANDLPQIAGSDSIVFQKKEELAGKTNADITYAESYYRLTPTDLEKLKIESDDDTKYTYIVNYSTGEVYNETKQKTSLGKTLYYAGKTGNQSPTATENEKGTDNTSFTE
jgi:Tfp pilus assembly protein PilE